MQLGLQALILRDNGYTCNEGIIYYRNLISRSRERGPLKQRALYSVRNRADPHFSEGKPLIVFTIIKDEMADRMLTGVH